MTDEQLEEIKIKYKSLINGREEIIQLRKRLEELKKSKEVQDYISLTEQLEKNKNKNLEYFTNRNLVTIALSNQNYTDGKEFFVYIGTYKYNETIDEYDTLLPRKDKKGDYVVYKSIESKEEEVIIPISQADQFEETHQVIIPKNRYASKSLFYKLQMEYFYTLINESQASANQNLKKLLKK